MRCLAGGFNGFRPACAPRIVQRVAVANCADVALLALRYFVGTAVIGLPHLGHSFRVK